MLIHFQNYVYLKYYFERFKNLGEINLFILCGRLQFQPIYFLKFKTNILGVSIKIQFVPNQIKLNKIFFKNRMNGDAN